MWFTEAMDIPDEIVEALEAGKLVIFVGAGASVRSPSDLPLFVSLVNRVAADLGYPDYDGAVHQSPDLYLERIERELAAKVDPTQRPMRERVAAYLGNPLSLPNDVHSAIVQLFTSVDQLRIVTTNYDPHLEDAATHRFGERPRVYSAPALPRGNDFTGIVHLHGALNGRLADLVLTSRDFGAAYLTEAWAARFLNDLFREYKTLFVGYSYDDLVMRYLALGLKEGTVRYGLLASDANPLSWQPLDLHPIVYAADHDHAELPRTIGEWASWRHMGLLDHEEQIRRAVEYGPPATLSAVSYLERSIKDAHIAPYFAKYARGVEWLDWLDQREPYPSLFRREAPMSGAGRSLADWFTAIIKDASEAALGAVQGHGGHLNETTAELIALSFHQSRPEPRTLGRWSILLTQHSGAPITTLLGYLLRGTRWPEDRDCALLLFEHLVELENRTRTELSLHRRRRGTDDGVSSGVLARRGLHAHPVMGTRPQAAPRRGDRPRPPSARAWHRTCPLRASCCCSGELSVRGVELCSRRH